jgi:hypothetical protein
VVAFALLGFASLAVALALGEAGLRLFRFSFPSFSLPDDFTGSRLRANMSGWNRIEGEALVRINSDGLRDREHPVAKAPGTVRIAVLGDSFAQAAEVSVEATFWSHLERALNACRAFGERRVEVLNFGVSGYGTAQELLTLRYRAWKYSPDIVLLAFFPGNDVRNNSKRLEPNKLRPFFVLHGGELVLDDSFLRDPEYAEIKRLGESRAALQNLRLYQLMRKLRAGELRLHHNTPIAAAIAQGKPAHLPMMEAGLDENVLREPQDPVWEEAWTITEKLLLSTSEEARRGGARFVLATLSSSGSVYPDPRVRKAYAAHLGVSDLFYPERRVRRLAQRNGVEIVTLGPEMQRLADATGAYYHGFPNTMRGFGHWNDAGHEVAGKLIARHLCERTSLPEGS